MNVVISPKLAEESATALQEALEFDYSNPYQEDRRDYRNYDKVINYGFARKIKGNVVFNDFALVKIAKDKLETFKTINPGVAIVQYTEDKEEAYSWIKHGYIVAVRSSKTGNNGKGLFFCQTKEELDKVDGLCYTKYVEHTHELRVNIFRGKIISVYNKTINGEHFKFSLSKELENYPSLVSMAKTLYEKLPLDFCGVDVVVTPQNNVVLLEVNSAPVLFPYTLKKLIKKIKEEIL